MKERQALILFFLSYFGESEDPSKTASNKRIAKVLQDMAEEMKYSENIDDSKIAYCCIFLEFACKSLNIKRTHKASARSWAKMPNKLDITEALPGDIVVLWSYSLNDWRGHVGLMINQPNRNKDYVYLLGANQNNKVCIQPYKKSRILAVIRPEFECNN